MFRARRSGFTLIELLVVIAIIAILAAILFPVFTMAKQHAQQVRCLSNLRNLASAIRVYADDYNGRMPSVAVRKDKWCGIPVPCPDWCGSVDTWKPVYPEKGVLWKYVNRSRALYQCPMDRNQIATDWRKNPEGGGPYTEKDARAYPLSYSMNEFVHRICLDSASMKKMSKMLLLIHEDRDTINDGLFMWGSFDANGTFKANGDIPGAVHYTGTTVAYLDGHSAWKPKTLLLKERNQGYWQVPAPINVK